MARVAMTLALAVFAGTLTCAGGILPIGLPVGLLIGQARAQSPGTPEDAPEQSAKEATAKKKSQTKKTKQDKQDSAGKAAAPGGQAAARDPGAIQQALETAQKSLDGGKAEQAATQATTLISDGGLNSRSMAKALSIRGQAYKKQNKPAQAIADLQSALWLRGGLNETERAVAMQARAEAYREAGLGEAPVIGGGKAASDQNRPAGGPTPAPAGSASLATAAVAPRPASGSTATPAQAPSGSGNGVGQFFSNMFGGGAKSQPAPVAAPVAAPADPAISSWSSATTSAIPDAKPAAKAATGAKTAATKTASAAGTAGPASSNPSGNPTGNPAGTAQAPNGAGAGVGKFRLQLAAVRSREEAQSTAERVKKDYAGQIGDQPYEINEAVFGNMGTFYRVRFGPYAEAAAPQAVCSALRGKGTDCMIISNDTR